MSESELVEILEDLDPRLLVDHEGAVAISVSPGRHGRGRRRYRVGKLRIVALCNVPQV